jgi:hypothetical protein
MLVKYIIAIYLVISQSYSSKIKTFVGNHEIVLSRSLLHNLARLRQQQATASDENDYSTSTNVLNYQRILLYDQTPGANEASNFPVSSLFIDHSNPEEMPLIEISQLQPAVNVPFLDLSMQILLRKIEDQSVFDRIQVRDISCLEDAPLHRLYITEKEKCIQHGNMKLIVENSNEVKGGELIDWVSTEGDPLAILPR